MYRDRDGHQAFPDQHSEPMVIPKQKDQRQETVGAAHPANEEQWEYGRHYPPVQPQGQFYPFGQIPPPPSYPYPSNYGLSEVPYPPSRHRPPTLMGLPMPFGMPEEVGGVCVCVCLSCSNPSFGSETQCMLACALPEGHTPKLMAVFISAGRERGGTICGSILFLLVSGALLDSAAAAPLFLFHKLMHRL